MCIMCMNVFILLLYSESPLQRFSRLKMELEQLKFDLDGKSIFFIFRYVMYVCMYVFSSFFLVCHVCRCGGSRESAERVYILATAAGDQLPGHFYQGSGRFFIV